MIELVVKEYCHSCLEFEPDVNKDPVTYYTEDLFLGEREYMTVCNTVIHCAHRHRCESMISQLKREMKKENTNGHADLG
jgi:hypothetical protein